MPGRWTGPQDVFEVQNLDDDTLSDVARQVLELNPDAHLHATQVLIWDDEDRNHNLIAVYAIWDKKLTVL